MKKLGIFALALATLSFVACDDKKNNTIDLNTLPNGFYVTEAGVDLIEANAMAQGLNEAASNEAREGMYEKYIILEAGKTYEFYNKKGANADKWGAALTYAADGIVTDNHEIAGYKGSLAANTTFTVNETALYHIVLDFDADGMLEGTGGAQCILVPVEWGIAGTLNSWGFLAATSVDGNKTTWTGVTFDATGSFKFKHNDCWKIELDDAHLIKANTNLGKDCVPGAANIEAEMGIYDITLEFVGAAAATEDCFKYTITKTGDVDIKDYSACELELVGEGVAEQDGAVADASSWGWGNTLSLGLPTKSGNVYTWTRSNVKLIGGIGFKVRTPGAEAQGEIAAFNFGIDGNNATVEADGEYTIIATVDAMTSEYTLTMVSASANAITVTGIVPAGWEHCYLWAWDADGNNVFAAWPGQELEIKEGKVTYTFLPTVESINVIFSNGDGAQTNDIKDITDDQEINIEENLK